MEVRIHRKFYKGPPDGFCNYCKRNYGNQTTKLIERHLEHAKAAKNLEKLLHGFTGRWHWLTGNRKFQISADLVGLKRLIFIPIEEEGVFVDSDGNLDNSKITGLIVIEIADTHNE